MSQIDERVRYAVCRQFDHPSFPTKLPDYKIGSDGSVWSKKYGKWKLMKQQKAATGHLTITLTDKGKQYPFLVHRLVLFAFIGTPPHLTECRHMNGDPTDNHFKNLRWDTHTNNMRDMKKHGTQFIPNLRGEQIWNSKLTDQKVREIHKIRAEQGLSCRKIAAMFDVSKSLIKQILRRKVWKHVNLN